MFHWFWPLPQHQFSNMAELVACILVLVTVQIALVQATGTLSVEDKKKMEQYRVVPDMISEVPADSITVKYGEHEVLQGNELTPTQVHEPPTNISWPADEGSYYTLIMVDPDIPAFVGAKEVQHWVVVNIPDNKIQEGETLFEYAGSGPPQGTGYHRYIFLVYKQDKKMDKKLYANIKDEKVESRRQYVLSELLTQFELKHPPVAGNFFRAEYDENVPSYHKERAEKYKKH